MNILKKTAVYIAIMIPVMRGFSVEIAKDWVKRVATDFTTNKRHTIKQKLWAYKHGYMPDEVDRYQIAKDNLKQHISPKDYLYIQPINKVYSKWINNRGISRKVFSPFAEHLQKVYYQLSFLNGNLQITILDDCPYMDDSRESVIRLIQDLKELTVTSATEDIQQLLTWRNEHYYLDGQLLQDEKELFKFISRFDANTILAEYIKPHQAYENQTHSFGNRLRVTVLNDRGNNPTICEAFLRSEDCFLEETDALCTKLQSFYHTKAQFYQTGNTRILKTFDDMGRKITKGYFSGIISHIDLDSGFYEGGRINMGNDILDVAYNFQTGEKIEGQIPKWEEIKQCILKMAMHTPQLAFFAVDVILSEDGFEIANYENIPQYPVTRPFRAETAKFLNAKLQEKRSLHQNKKVRCAIALQRIGRRMRKIFAYLFFPAGLMPYLSIRWLKVVLIDFFTNRDTSLATKIWAYHHGFLSYRIDQYGITRENHIEYISDFEYMWLRHINGNYRVMFEDKITLKYIVNQFPECFPEYYYHIKTDNDENVVIPMMDCADKNSHSFNDIFELVRQKGTLALKPDEGSHGDGFYRFSYERGTYYLNLKKVSKEDVLAVLQNPENQYLVTEYIKNHPQFKRIYEGAVNTIRMIVFKSDGKTPTIGNAYMRFGSKATGAVDNMGAGGIFVRVDIESGRYGEAKILTHNSIVDCPKHPDTGVKIEGIIPHWEQVKQTVLKVAASIPQLEYFGFDIAVTEEGIKFPEINRMPDYPKIEQLSPITMRYLLEKLAQKKRIYGYDKKPCKKLIHLPKR